MRIVIFIIAAVHFVIWLYGTTTGPAIPEAIRTDSIWTMFGLALAIVTTPALILALTGRFLKAALILVLLPELFLAVSWFAGW